MSKSKLRNKWMRKHYTGHHQAEVPKNKPSRYITTHCHAHVEWLQESTSFGGHSIPTGGHRKVSGLVRASVKEEIRQQIDEELSSLL